MLLKERTKELVESGRYDTREDFTVVLQPFLTHVDMPKTQVKQINKTPTLNSSAALIFQNCPNLFW